MHMSSTVRYIYCQMQEMLEKAAEYFYPGNMEKPWEQNGTDFFSGRQKPLRRCAMR